MSSDPMFSPRLRRAVGRADEYEPVRLGSDDATAVIRVYANPYMEDCRAYFDDVHDELKVGVLEADKVAFEVRPTAPEMRIWTTGLALDVRRRLTGAYPAEARVAPTDAAEFFHAVREAAGGEAFLSVVERACLLPDNGMMTYNRLMRFADDLDADVDGRELLDEVERGTYRGRVRHDSGMWIRRIGKVNDEGDIASASVFVDAEPLPEMSYSSLKSQVLSRLQLDHIEEEAQEAE